MKYLDKGIIYIPIDKNTTQEEIKKLKETHNDKTVVFLRSGSCNIKTTISNLLKASL